MKTTLKIYVTYLTLAVIIASPFVSYAQNSDYDYCLNEGGTPESCAGADSTDPSATDPSTDSSYDYNSYDTTYDSSPSTIPVPYSGSNVNAVDNATSPTTVSSPTTAGQPAARTSTAKTPSASDQAPAPAPVTTLSNPLKGVNSVSDLILTFMKIVSYIAVIFGVLMLMWVGLQFVLAQGNPEAIKTRSNQLLWVVVGIGVILGARILISVVINTLQATGTVNPAIIQNAQNAINNQ
ncbi:MAG: hypothetical protein V4524_03095 [Patescibacteria group bacterium]